MLRSSLRSLLRKLGYVISRYDHRRDPLAVRKLFLESNSINVVYDVGANTGQYALQLRETGYTGGIVSIEPLSVAFRTLAEAARIDTNWQARQCALGDTATTGEINIAGNSWSSSLLNMLPLHAQSAPESAYIGKEVISIQTLDSLFYDYCTQSDKVFLKIDTQGFTKKVLDGAHQSLEHIAGIQVEMSLIPLYEGEPLIGELVSFLYSRGFTLIFLIPGFIDNHTGQQLQVDGLFFRL